MFVFEEPIPQQKFSREMISREMECLFRHFLTTKNCDPPHIDDLAEFIDYEMSDENMSNICQSPIVGLREKIYFELVEIDLSLPDDSSVGGFANYWKSQESLLCNFLLGENMEFTNDESNKAMAKLFIAAGEDIPEELKEWKTVNERTVKWNKEQTAHLRQRLDSQKTKSKESNHALPK